MCTVTYVRVPHTQVSHMCLRTYASVCYTRRSAYVLVPHKTCQSDHNLRANLVHYSRTDYSAVNLVGDLVDDLVRTFRI